MFDRLLYIPLIVGPVFFILGYFMAKKPPKDINSLFAYKSKSATKSQERWDFAQSFAFRELMNLGFFLTLTCLIGRFIELDNQSQIIAGLALVIFTLVLLVFKTEKAIKDIYGKN